jgi:hypothetical protein
MTETPALRDTEPYADCIRHVIEVNSALDGIASVAIFMRGLRATGAVELARIITPCCQIDAEERVRTSGAQVTRLGPAGARYVLAEPSGLREIEWRYNISNAVQLSQFDLSHCDRAARWESMLSANESWNPYQVRMACGQFVQELALPRDIRIRYLRGYAAREHNNQQRTVECQLPPVEISGNRATLTVDNPEPGVCYGIVYEAYDGSAADLEATHSLSDQIVDTCLKEVTWADGLSKHASQQIHVHLLNTLVAGKAVQMEHTDWAVLLWSSEHRRLVPVFCNGPLETWGLRFAYGNGIAGHSFRFGLPAGYVKPRKKAKPSLIYQSGSEVEGFQSTEYQWLASFPLAKADAGATPLGVLILCGKDTSEPLAALAKKLVDSNSTYAQLQDALLNVNFSFWCTLLPLAEGACKALVPHRQYIKEAWSSFHARVPGGASALSQRVDQAPASLRARSLWRSAWQRIESAVQIEFAWPPTIKLSGALAVLAAVIAGGFYAATWFRASLPQTGNVPPAEAKSALKPCAPCEQSAAPGSTAPAPPR